MIFQRIHDFVLRSMRVCIFCHLLFRLDTTFIASHAPRVIDTPDWRHEGVWLWRWWLWPVCCGLYLWRLLFGLEESRYHECSLGFRLDLAIWSVTCSVLASVWKFYSPWGYARFPWLKSQHIRTAILLVIVTDTTVSMSAAFCALRGV